jgi:hypothetical protein
MISILSYLTYESSYAIIVIMSRQTKAMSHSIEIVRLIITAHQKLFVDIYLTNSPEIEAIIEQMIHAKLHHKSIRLYQYLVEAFLLAGGGDQSNHGYYEKQKVKPTFNRVKRALKAAHCPKLASFETFKGCGYRKTMKNCNEPTFLSNCSLPTFDMKRGALNHMAFSLYFFLRDVAGRDFYTYVTEHFGQGQLSSRAMNELIETFIGKITTIANVGPKLAHMALSCLFLTTYPGWDYRQVGAHMTAVDTLVHNFLHRTGILDCYQLDHPYGPRCHAQTGCLGVIHDLANRIDCREFNPTLPADFPRFIQYHIWAYCGQAGENICNGNKCKPGKPNPDCILHQQRLCAQLPPRRPVAQSRDEYLFP